MMSTLNNFIATVLSMEAGHSDDGINLLTERWRANPDPGPTQRIRADVVALLSDPNADWISLVDSEYCMAFPAETQEEAKDFVLQKVCKPLGIEVP